MAHEAGFLTLEHQKLHPKNISLAQHELKDYGWWTDYSSKVKYAFKVSQLQINFKLILKKARSLIALDNVFIMKDFICANPFVDEHTRRDVLDSKFREQVQRFRVVTTKPKEAHSIPRVTVSGKVDKDGKISGSHQDDLMMAFCMNLYVWEQLMERAVPNFDYQTVFGRKI